MTAATLERQSALNVSAGAPSAGHRTSPAAGASWSVCRRMNAAGARPKPALRFCPRRDPLARGFFLRLSARPRAPRACPPAAIAVAQRSGSRTPSGRRAAPFPRAPSLSFPRYDGVQVLPGVTERKYKYISMPAAVCGRLWALNVCGPRPATPQSGVPATAGSPRGSFLSNPKP